MSDPLTLTGRNLKQVCNAFLADEARRLVPLLGVPATTRSADITKAVLGIVADVTVARKQVLALPAMAKLVSSCGATDQQWLSTLFEAAELLVSGVEATHQDAWTTLIVFPWCRGSLGSRPLISTAHTASFDVSAHLYFDLMGQPALAEALADEDDDEYKTSTLASMVMRRYFLQFASRLRWSIQSSELERLIDWASIVVGQDLTLP